MPTLKEKGLQGEHLAKLYYQEKGFHLRDQNFTIPNAEIDLVFENKELVIFVEVKVVDGIEDWTAYLSPRKIAALERGIDTYCFRKGIEKEVRLDLVFIQRGKVVECFENITNT